MNFFQAAVKWLLPSEQHFFDHTDAAADAALRAGQLLVELSLARGREQQLVLVERLRDAEHDGDEAMRRMSEALDKTFVTPIDREDLYLLTSSVESISDFVCATANHLTVHNLETFPDGAQELAALVGKATEEIHTAVKLLRNHRDDERIRKAVRSLHYIEHEADVIFRLRLGDLFANEKDAIQLIKKKEFLEGLENAVDRCQSVGKVLENIAIKHG